MEWQHILSVCFPFKTPGGPSSMSQGEFRRRLKKYFDASYANVPYINVSYVDVSYRLKPRLWTNPWLLTNAMLLVKKLLIVCIKVLMSKTMMQECEAETHGKSYIENAHDEHISHSFVRQQNHALCRQFTASGLIAVKQRLSCHRYTFT